MAVIFLSVTVVIFILYIEHFFVLQFFILHILLLAATTAVQHRQISCLQHSLPFNRQHSETDDCLEDSRKDY